jgi:hypothetical protein
MLLHAVTSTHDAVSVCVDGKPPLTNNTQLEFVYVPSTPWLPVPVLTTLMAQPAAVIVQLIPDRVPAVTPEAYVTAFKVADPHDTVAALMPMVQPLKPGVTVAAANGLTPLALRLPVAVVLTQLIPAVVGKWTTSSEAGAVAVKLTEPFVVHVVADAADADASADTTRAPKMGTLRHCSSLRARAINRAAVDDLASSARRPSQTELCVVHSQMASAQPKAGHWFQFQKALIAGAGGLGPARRRWSDAGDPR